MLDLPRQLGPYRVVRAIGRGGMGAVYLARDQRLDRDELVRLCKSIARVCDDDTISLEDAAFGYIGLLVIERYFRSLEAHPDQDDADISLASTSHRGGMIGQQRLDFLSCTWGSEQRDIHTYAFGFPILLSQLSVSIG